ncbi:Sulfate/thiosulfate import ATP-binding protein CysA [Variovorax sp. SRS16]|uniref:ABC transporter ATP-binding protein n=1 Tax=Variovorax sp. SRS16 TaxID=282217 RepID=UPI001315DB0E|nr:ABC transporter ATP-binding protein [Variovorax sp. SRS16]VTU26794.1 Sulfate/thiosulfate import ATP-binding protein CysA [Variovorax sp. SRS16]
MPDAKAGTAAPQSLLVLQGISKRYGATTAVGPIDLDVRRGEFLTLLGPSGCGKTTTLQIIAGLVGATAGQVRLDGREMTGVATSKRDMGVVFQNYALFPHKTVFDNVGFGLRMRKMPREQIRERVRRMLETVGLPGVEERMPEQLSGGQRQRVALARALVIEPKVLLLDEPLSNLDAMLRKRMRHEIRDLQQRLRITTIFVTHDQDEAFEMSDRVALLNKGRVEQIGSPEDLYDSPATRFVAEFIGDANLVEGRVVAAQASGEVRIRVAGDTDLPARAVPGSLRVGDAAYLMLRPERIELMTEAPASGEALPARLVKRVFSGEQLSLELETASGVRLVCTKPSLPRFRQLAAGDAVWLFPTECRALKVDAT